MTRGVERYTKGMLHIPVYFPDGQVCCWYCPMLIKHTEECRLTGETIYRPRQLVGRECPVQLRQKSE